MCVFYDGLVTKGHTVTGFFCMDFGCFYHVCMGFLLVSFHSLKTCILRWIGEPGLAPIL